MPYDDEKIKRSAYTKTDESTKPRNRISSGHFKKSTSFQVFHNSSIRPDYAIGGELSYTLKGYEALKLKEKIIQEAKEAYTQHTGQKFQAKSYEWSLVVNLKPESTMQDLEKLSEHFFKKYGFQCYQIAIHRDEGHINEQGEKVINHHAHLEFITLDKQTGKNNYNRQKISPKVLREIQKEIADILEMERGQDRRLTGRQRIEPRQYAQMKEAEKRERKELEQELENLKGREKEIIQELENIKKEKETTLNQVKSKNDEMLTKKQIITYIELIRKQSIGKGYPKEFFNALSAFKKEVIQNNKKLSLKEIQERINKIFEPFDEILKENKALKQEQENQQSKINALESDLKQKKQKNEEFTPKKSKNDLNAKESDLNSDNNLLDNEKEYLENLARCNLTDRFNKIYTTALNKIIEPKSEKQKQNLIKGFEKAIKDTETFLPFAFRKWENDLMQENIKTRKKEKINYKEILEQYKNTPSKEQLQNKEIYTGRS